MLRAGMPVIMQNSHTGVWDRPCVITKVRQGGGSYCVKDRDGRSFLRARRFLKEIDAKFQTQSQQKSPRLEKWVQHPVDPNVCKTREQLAAEQKQKVGNH